MGLQVSALLRVRVCVCVCVCVRVCVRVHVCVSVPARYSIKIKSCTASLFSEVATERDKFMVHMVCMLPVKECALVYCPQHPTNRPHQIPLLGCHLLCRQRRWSLTSGTRCSRGALRQRWTMPNCTLQGRTVSVSPSLLQLPVGAVTTSVSVQQLFGRLDFRALTNPSCGHCPLPACSLRAECHSVTSRSV